MKSTLLKLSIVVGVVALGAITVHGLIPNDGDGDGVPDPVDLCPAEDASGFDRNGDGCVDAFAGARHIEYWGDEDATVTYLINDQGAPGIPNPSDLDAIQSAVASWTGIANTELNVVYGGTTPQTNANGLDRVNLVTFLDDDYPFSSLVLAVGLSTSFEADTTIDGRVYRPGEIFDADMVFNPTKTFKVGGAGPGTDIQSVATHEAGHLFGISHSAVLTSTMFYVLPAGLEARTLESDDELVYFKAYGTAAALAAANRLDVQVTDGQSGDPVPGAIVFVIDAATEDTSGCDYTLPDGHATFPGLPNGSYYVAIHPLNGTSPIGFIEPGNINSLLVDIANVNFPPESFDAAESNTDDPAARTAIDLGGATQVATAAIVTNIDATPPTVVNTTPFDGTTDVPIDGAYRVRFSEAIDVSTLSAAFSFRDDATLVAKAGNLAILKDDTVVVFIPSPPLEFAHDYTLTFDTDLTDAFGNHLASPFMLSVATEDEPALSLTSLAPTKGVEASTVVLGGQGFEDGATVTFNGTPAIVLATANRQISVRVPTGATTGPVVVTNPDMTTSNALTFTVLSPAELARGYESGRVVFNAVPKALTVLPDGSYAYVATADGAESIVVDPSLADYLTSTHISYSLGFDDVASTPSGRRVYAVSNARRELVEINSDPTSGLLFNTILDSRDVSAHPLGIVIDPAGNTAYIATDESEVQVWDIHLGSPTYRQQIGAIAAPFGAGVTGAMAMTPSGDRLLFATDTGRLVVHTLATQFSLSVQVGSDPRAIVVDPQGARAYVAHGDGDVSIVALQAFPTEVQDIASGGSLRGLAMTPGGSYVYASDRELDNLKIVDLVETNATFRSVIAEIGERVDPVDVAMSPDGVYAFSVLQGNNQPGEEPRLLVTTVGAGPVLVSVSPTAARVGDMVVVSGSDFGDPDLVVPFIAFNGVRGETIRRTFNMVVATVPPGATSGAVTIEVDVHDPNTGDISVTRSNPLNFQVLETGTGGMRFAATLEPLTATGEQANAAIAITPRGDAVFLGYGNGDIRAYDIRPSSVDFHKEVLRFSPNGRPVKDIGITADGKTGFVLLASGGSGDEIHTFVADINDPNFGQPREQVPGSFGGQGLTVMAMSPTNYWMMVWDGELNDLHVIDATGVSTGATPTVYRTLAPAGSVQDIAFHPSGLSAYIATDGANAIQTISMDPNLGFFATIVQTNDFGTSIPMSLAPSPDGFTLYAYSSEAGPSPLLRIHEFTLTDAATYFEITSGSPPTVINNEPSGFVKRRLRMSPRDNRMVRAMPGAFEQFNPAFPLDVISSVEALETSQPNDFEFTPDGSRLYVASEYYDLIREYDFAGDGFIQIASGDNQSGQTGDELPAPIRVRVIGASAPGIPITFSAQPGNGFFVVPCDGLCLRQEIIVATDKDGYAEARWWLLGEGSYSVDAYADGIGGVMFHATAVADPSSVPLTQAEVIPLDNTNNVSISTAALVTFSRAIESTSINAMSLFIQSAADATKIPVAFGFTDDDRKVSLTPLQPLNPSAVYDIVSTVDILGRDGGVLTNPSSASFTTQAPAPLRIASIYPPSGLPGTPVVISGTGFDTGANLVNFGTAQATGQGNAVEIAATVSVSATVGTIDVTVTTGSGTSNALPFTVLPAGTSSIDDVVGTVGTGTGTKSVVLTADGALCYSVGTDGDVVIPVDVEGQTTYPSIPVGDQPVAIVMHPRGEFAYVANFNSGTVSVISVDPDSPDFNTVVDNITVGTGPIDLAISPDGDRLVVANATSSSLSIIDGNQSSETYHQVVGTVGSGTGTKSVTISADGTRIFVGWDLGVIIFAAGTNDVVGSVNTNSATKSVVISPDGALLFALGVDGTLSIIDIHAGSPSENQVVGTVGTGTGTKSVAISADGTLLYLVQEDSDTVLVVSLEIIPAVGVTNPDAAAAFTVVTHVVDELHTGDDPVDIAIDPRGTGRVIVANAGDKTLTIFGFAPVITNPEAGETVGAGTLLPIRWTSPSGGTFEAVDIQFSSDGGQTYQTIAQHIPNSGEFPWVTPMGDFPNSRIRVALFAQAREVGAASVSFSILRPVPVRLKSFDVAIEKGSAVLRWETNLEVGMEGYRIVRSEREEGRYDEITHELIASSGATTGGKYEYRDETVSANRTYWYKLQEVAEDGLGAEYGPYSVTYILSNALEQNVPNPFNPTTTIGYAIAKDGEVSLTIYDVGGRRVRTLVNERQRADVYHVTWDGANDVGQRVASGVYFYKLGSGKFTQTKKMVLLK